MTESRSLLAPVKCCPAGLALPSAKEERHCQEEIDELWRRYKQARRNARWSSYDSTYQQQCRERCRLILRQLNAVIRQDWPEPEPTRVEWPSQLLTYRKSYSGWKPGHVGHESKTMNMPSDNPEEARRFWVWLQKWEAGEV